MRFATSQKLTHSSDITKRGFKVMMPGKHYTNSKGKTTHHPRGRKPMSFVSVDGEGMTVNGEHRYVLFGIGEDQIENELGLQWYDVFEFLYNHYEPNTAYVGFFLGYDFTQILKTLPEDRAWMLLTAEGRALRRRYDAGKGVKGRKPLAHLAPHPVECDGWQFDMLAMKRLRIRPKLCNCPLPTCKCKPKAPWMYINDVGGFFQSSFLTVINPKDWAEGTAVVTPEEFELIKVGKEKRSVAILDDDMRMYNRLENVVLSRVMTVLDKGFQEIGIELPPSKWFGPGQAAQAWLKNENVPTGEEINKAASIEMIEAARMSYFGGWFELMMHGIIPGESHEYDINSAYPSVIASLPCLMHGEYSRGEGLPVVDDGDLCLVYAKVWSPGIGGNEKKQHIGAMLHRDAKGGISRPMASESWYWWDELKAAEKCKLIKRLDNRGHQQVMRWVKYRPCDCPPPMATIAGLYQKRLEVGKTSPLGKSAKLTYNSAYGKFAQSVGEPVFGNPIYASRITAGCRTKILEAIATHPRGKADVAMVATDAVYFLTLHPTLPLSDKLGEWDYKTKHNLTLFKPGVYWDDKARDEIAAGKSPHFKARGFVARDFVANISRIDDEFRAWAERPPQKTDNVALSKKSHSGWPSADFTPSFAMITALQALRRNNWDLAGMVSDASTLTQDSNPYQKRTGFDSEIYDNDRPIYRTRPYANIWYDDSGPQWEASQPYVKRFGMDDPFSDEYKEQLGVTEDGNIADILAWILKGE